MEYKRTRINWVDYTKGIGIILTIVGHTVRYGALGSICRGMIFSFHMPLFFILSSYTFSYSDDKTVFYQKTKRSLLHLLVPVLEVTAFYIAWELFNAPRLVLSSAFWKDTVYRLVIASGVEENFGSYKVQPLGMPWFLFALFLGRTSYNYLKTQKQDMFVMSVIFSLIGICVGVNGNFFPFSLDVALASFLFLWFGEKMKELFHKEITIKDSLIYLSTWVLTLGILYPNWREWTYLELAARRYSLFPISYICAISGTLFFCAIGKWIERAGAILYPIKWIGQKSIDLLLIHHLDGIWIYLWYEESHQFYTSIRRVVVDLSVLALFALLKRETYKIKRRMQICGHMLKF